MARLLLSCLFTLVVLTSCSKTYINRPTAAPADSTQQEDKDDEEDDDD